MPHRGIYSATGIILKRINWAETDKIFTIFTKEHGKMRVVAKGVRKITSKRAGYLEPFHKIRCTIHSGSKIDTLSEVESLGVVQKNLNFEQIAYLYFICELVDHLIPENEPHVDQYYLLEEAVYDPEIGHPKLEEKKYSFANTLLQQLGYLEKHRRLPTPDVTAYIEQIIERKLKSPRFSKFV